MAETNFGGPQDQQKADGPSSLGVQYTQRNTAGSKAADRPRVIWLDLGRSAALLGMIVFHFARDMEMFGWLAPGTTLSGGWALFARLIAGLFIFLSGISFVLAHRQRIDWHAWARRVLAIAGSASLVTLVTYVAFPGQFIYFGILHAIAFFSVVGLIFLRVPVLLTSSAAFAMLVVEAAFGKSLISTPWLAWTGLSTAVRPAMDFIPVVPWFAAFLCGMAFAEAAPPALFWARSTVSTVTRLLAWPGRHSLLIYLVHQPALIALFWIVRKGIG